MMNQVVLKVKVFTETILIMYVTKNYCFLYINLLGGCVRCLVSHLYICMAELYITRNSNDFGMYVNFNRSVFSIIYDITCW